MKLSLLFVAITSFSLILSGCGSDIPDNLPGPNPHLDYSLQIEGNGSLTGVWLLATDTRSETFKATENASGDIVTTEEGSGYFKQVLIIKEISKTEVALNVCGLNDDIAYQRDGNTFTNEFIDDTGQSIDEYSTTFQFNGNNEMTFGITNKSTRFELIDDTERTGIYKKYSNGRAIKISNSEILKQWKQDTLIVNYLTKEGNPVIDQQTTFPINCFYISEMDQTINELEFSNYIKQHQKTLNIASHHTDRSIMGIYQSHTSGEDCSINPQTNTTTCSGFKNAIAIIDYMNPIGVIESFWASHSNDYSGSSLNANLNLEGNNLHAQGTISNKSNEVEMHYEFYLNH